MLDRGSHDEDAIMQKLNLISTHQSFNVVVYLVETFCPQITGRSACLDCANTFLSPHQD